MKIYLNIYESIMRALDIQIDIQKYAWIFKKKMNIYLNIQFFEYLFCEINIHKCLEYSSYLWIFMIFKWGRSPDVLISVQIKNQDIASEDQ